MGKRLINGLFVKVNREVRVRYTSYYIPRYLSVKPFFSINIMHTVVEMNTIMKLNDR